MVAGMMGTVGAQTAPECSTVSYNGDGTETSPYEVGNVDQLQCIEDQDLDGNYVQVSDIDASGTSSWNDGDGFEPIGAPNLLGRIFSGKLDGNGHSIEGLTINRPDTDNVGIFSILNGEVDGVVLENADVEGNSSVGALAGQANGATVNASSATGSVVGSSTTGGLVGYNLASGSLENSSASVDVDGGNQAGGIVGQNDGVVSDSYSRGDVTGDDTVGGLAGFNGFSGAVTTSYATGTVSANANSGGLIGVNINVLGTVAGDSYWDTQTTGQPSSAGDGTGLTTSDMTGSAASSNMAEFDFTKTWVAVTSPDEYPILSWQQEGDDGGSGTSIDNIQTSLSDTDGDDLPDRVEVGVTVSDAARTEIALGEGNFEVDASPTDDTQGSLFNELDPDGDGTPEGVQIDEIGGASTTYTVVADLSDQSGGDTGTVDVTVEQGADTDSATYTVETSAGPLNPNNPFGDANNEPLAINDAADVLFQWNQNDGTVNGTDISLSDMADFLFEWNQARN
jgi:hypothetical protein